METLAYLHLALANESPISTDDTTSQSTEENPQRLTWLNRSKLSLSTAIQLLSFTVALSVLGMARQASAAIQQGDRGSEVTSLQERLKELGYFKTDVTGYFGRVTQKAVTQFQQDKGLEVDGVVGRKTQASLNPQTSSSEESQSSSPSPSESSSESPKSVLQLGDRGEQVTAIQKKLSLAGFSSGDNGVFDETTQDAVQQFQHAKGLKADGIVGQQTLAALPDEDGSQPKAAPRKSTSFFDNQSAPLVPFIRKSN